MNKIQTEVQVDKHRFESLHYATGLAGEIKIMCASTKRKAAWNDAVKEGWFADLNGKAFAAYYSPEGKQNVEAAQ